jgi:hypothetical protein
MSLYVASISKGEWDRASNRLSATVSFLRSHVRVRDRINPSASFVTAAAVEANTAAGLDR